MKLGCPNHVENEVNYQFSSIAQRVDEEPSVFVIGIFLLNLRNYDVNTPLQQLSSIHSL